MASFVLSFFPLDVLDGIWDLIESVSEGFLTYLYNYYIGAVVEWLETLANYGEGRGVKSGFSKLVTRHSVNSEVNEYLFSNWGRIKKRRKSVVPKI